MSISKTPFESPVHWRYLLSLEEELAQVAKYVEIARDNFETYSTELASLLLSAGSEIDVVAKQLCAKARAKPKKENMWEYGNKLAPQFPAIARYEVDIPRFGVRLRPWTNWSLTHRKNPYWWKAQNEVKHRRHTHFRQASLGNALNAVAGLYVLVLFFYSELATEGRLSPNPVLFRPAPDFHRGTAVWDTEILIVHELHLT